MYTWASFTISTVTYRLMGIKTWRIITICIKAKNPTVKSFETAKGDGGRYQKLSIAFSKITARAEEVVQRIKSKRMAQKISFPT